MHADLTFLKRKIFATPTTTVQHILSVPTVLHCYNPT